MNGLPFGDIGMNPRLTQACRAARESLKYMRGRLVDGREPFFKAMRRILLALWPLGFLAIILFALMIYAAEVVAANWYYWPEDASFLYVPVMFTWVAMPIWMLLFVPIAILLGAFAWFKDRETRHKRIAVGNEEVSPLRVWEDPRAKVFAELLTDVEEERARTPLLNDDLARVEADTEARIRLDDARLRRAALEKRIERAELALEAHGPLGEYEEKPSPLLHPERSRALDRLHVLHGV